MKRIIPDYFIALVKQRAGLLNDTQTMRAIEAMSKTIQSSLTPAQANQFFALVPAYVRPQQKTFFATIGDWQKPVSNQSATEQLIARLQLTSVEEASVIMQAYFYAIQTVVGRDQALKLSSCLPTDLARLYTHARAF